MERVPYSLPDAEKLCTEYQFLVGKPFAPGSNSIIECVTISPFDEISRKRFLIYYFLFNNPQSALAHEYKGFLYDILVIARSLQDEHELLQEDLSSWLKENNLSTGSNKDMGHSLSSAMSYT